MIICKKYIEQDKGSWNSFIEEGKNQTFLFNRNFMDYHSDRFLDYSLMVYVNNRLVSIIPANICDGKIYSHQGLSYGGFVFRKDEKLTTIIQIIREVLKYLFDNGIEELYYKAIPRFYNTLGSDEIDYALFLLNADIYRRDTALCISMDSKLAYQKRRQRSINKAKKKGVEIKACSSFDSFWKDILVPNLKMRFGVAPVHSLKEINKLASAFPNNIKQFNAYLDNKIIAGTTIFETSTVAHAQYISASEIGRNSGGLDLLFDYLIDEVYIEKKYFDFGISNENEGKSLNHGLLEWKEGFGGRSFSHDFYIIETKNYNKLNTVLK